MPELPEVETVRATLARHLPGRTVSAVEILRPAQVRYPDPATFRAELEGQSFTEPGRRGKYLLLRLAHGSTLVCHLRMSGRLYLAPAGAERIAHTHVVFHLDDGRELRYQDMRTFGGFHWRGLMAAACPGGLLELGPEPIDPLWQPTDLARALAGRRAPIKALLLDQRTVAGLGNIYVDEALFRAGLHPALPAGAAPPAGVERLHAAIRAVLAEAIARRGTTFSLYFDGEGRPGDYYDSLRVFDRRGQPCPNCGTEIRKIRLAGRGTHYCPRCQPLPQ